jgi:tetratricopeptide (TPR) repeat protein
MANPFRGVIDLIDMKQVSWDEQTLGVSYHRGDLQSAKENLEISLQLYNEDLHGQSAFLFGSDHRELATGFYSLTLWALGFQQESVRVQQQVVDYCEQLGHFHSIAQARVFLAFVTNLAKAEQAYEVAASLVEYTEKASFPMMGGAALCFKGIAEYRNGNEREGLREMVSGAQQWWSTGACNYRPYIEMTLASCFLHSGELRDAHQYLRAAEEHMHAYQEYWCHPELLRIQGLFAAAQDHADTAEEHYLQALTKADAMSSRSWRNRARQSYALLLHDQQRAAEAQQLMQPQPWERDLLDSEAAANDRIRALLGV